MSVTLLANLLATLPAVLAQAGNNPQQQSGDTGWLVLWAVLLLGAAILLFFIEVFLPSGGIVGMASAVCLILGLVLLFQVDTMWGLLGATVAMVALPFAIGFSLKMFPNTPIARALTLRSKSDKPGEDEVSDEGVAVAASSEDKAQANGPAVGATGKTISELRPVGTCVIDGKREQCLAVGGVIDSNTPVQVVAVDGMHIRVKAVDGQQ